LWRVGRLSPNNRGPVHKNKSDIEIANKYIEMVNQNNSGYFSELKKIMDENGYKYEILENGGIRYWVNSY
jgi:hypothetical protein